MKLEAEHARELRSRLRQKSLIFVRPEIKLLRQMQNDISFMKNKIIIMEEEIDAISGDMHEVRPKYIKRIQEIEKKGKFRSFKSVDELKKAIEA